MAQTKVSLEMLQQEVIDAIEDGPGASVWGSVTGTLSAQTDLQAALDGKQSIDSDLTTWAGITPSASIAAALPNATNAAGGLVSVAGLAGGTLPISGTTLAASGVTTLTAGTASTSTGTGTLVVTGGAGFSGAVWAGNTDSLGFRVSSTVFLSSAGCSVESADSYAFGVRSKIFSSADGEVSLRNNANSANANLTLGNLTASGTITGAHDGTVGATTPAAGSFTTLAASGTFTFNSATLSASSGTPTLAAVGSNKDVIVTPTGGGSLVVSNGNIYASALKLSSGSGTVQCLTALSVTGSITASGYVKLGAYTVATLPGSPTAGMTAYVTDALAPTYGATLVGGGAIVARVLYNGTAWTTQ